MAEPSSKPVAAGARSPLRSGAAESYLADHHTPLIRNCWYVAAWSRELASGELLGRRIAHQQVVLFRDASGVPRTLQGRCPHRSFPLHRGALEDGTVVCGYHGLRFDGDGRCVEIPSEPSGERCSAFAIDAYETIEQEPFIWVWLGDTEAADPALIPDHHWLSDPGWAYASGTVDIEANYVGLHENLLDTTHFSFLHAGNVGTPEYATAQPDLEETDAHVRLYRRLDNAPLPALYDEAMGLVGVPVTRITDSYFISPGWHAAHAEVQHPQPDGSIDRYRTRILHGITPISQHQIRYFWALARDYRIEDASVTELQQRLTETAFEEDRLALEWISELKQSEEAAERSGATERIVATERIGATERSVAADRGGLRMRRRLKALADAECPTVPLNLEGAQSGE